MHTTVRGRFRHSGTGRTTGELPLPFSLPLSLRRRPPASPESPAPRLSAPPASVEVSAPADLPPGPCINFRVRVEAVTGREARPFPAGVITLDGKIEDESTGLTRLVVDTRNLRGEGVLAGRLPGQPDGIDRCWDVAAVLTHFRGGEVLDRQLYHADPPGRLNDE